MAKNKVENISNRNRNLEISGVGNKLHADLKNICKNIGCSLSDFTKTKLADIVHNYPQEYKKYEE